MLGKYCNFTFIKLNILCAIYNNHQCVCMGLNATNYRKVFCAFIRKKICAENKANPSLREKR